MLIYDEVIAKRYAKTRGLPVEAADQWSREMSSIVPPEDVQRVLDGGCGVGRFLPVLLCAFPRAHVHGVEPSAAMRGLALAHAGTRCTITPGAFPNLPLPSDRFDLVFLSMVLHHCADRVAVVRECLRLLRPGGTLAIRTGTKESIQSFEFLHFFPEALDVETSAMPATGEVEQWLTQGGFTQVRCRSVQQRLWLSYLDYHSRVDAGGFPSFAFLSPGQLAQGRRAFAVHCRKQAAANSLPPPESVLLAWATKPTAAGRSAAEMTA